MSFRHVVGGNRERRQIRGGSLAVPLTAAGASLVAVGVLRVSRQGMVRKSSQGLGGGGGLCPGSWPSGPDGDAAASFGGRGEARKGDGQGEAGKGDGPEYQSDIVHRGLCALKLKFSSGCSGKH